jgi:hypothetical protein
MLSFLGDAQMNIEKGVTLSTSSTYLFKFSDTSNRWIGQESVPSRTFRTKHAKMSLGHNPKIV